MPITPYSPYRGPKLPNDYSSYLETNSSIPVGSSLSVMGALLVIARKRFEGPVPADNSNPYIWVRDASLGPNEYQEDVQKSNITIEIDAHNDKDDKDKRPAILISRSAIQSQKLVLDDKVTQRLQSGSKSHHNLVNGAFRMVCRGQNRGVAEVLANIMFEWLVYCENIFRKEFQFHEVGPFTLGQERPMQKQTDVYECAVDFRLAWEHRWRVQPIAPTLNKISFNVFGTYDPTASLEELSEDPDALLARLAAASLSKG